MRSPIFRRELVPFRMAGDCLPVRLFRLGQSPSRALARRMLRKPAMRAFRALQRGGRDWRATARFEATGKPFAFNALNAQFHAIYRHPDGYEVEVMAAVRALVPVDGVLIDAGANWGYFAVALAGEPEFRGKVYAFEPSQTSFADLQSVSGQLGIGDDRLVAHRVGLSDRAAPGRLANDEPAQSGYARVSDAGGEPIELKPLDAYTFARADMIKIDVEGHELAMLEGARQTLLRHRPAIVIENWFRRATATADIAPLRLLHELGYSLYFPGLRNPSRPEEVIIDLGGASGDAFELALLPFLPEQRGFFGKRHNVVALPEGVKLS